MAKPAPAKPVDAATAARLFAEKCGSCHGVKGEGGSAKRLSGTSKSDDEFVKFVRDPADGNHGFRKSALPQAGVLGIHAWLAGDPSPVPPPPVTEATKHDVTYGGNARLSAKKPLSQDPFTLSGAVKLFVDWIASREKKTGDQVTATNGIVKSGARLSGRFVAYPDARGGYAFLPGEGRLFVRTDRFGLNLGLFLDTLNWANSRVLGLAATYGTSWLSGTVRAGATVDETRKQRVPEQHWGYLFYSAGLQASPGSYLQGGAVFQQDFSPADGSSVDRSLRAYATSEVFNPSVTLKLVSVSANCTFSLDSDTRVCAADAHLEGNNWGLDAGYEHTRGQNRLLPNLTGQTNGGTVSAVWHPADSMSVSASVALNDVNVGAHAAYFVRRGLFSFQLDADYFHTWAGGDALRLRTDLGFNWTQIPRIANLYFGAGGSYIYDKNSPGTNIFRINDANVGDASARISITPDKSPVTISGQAGWARGQLGGERDRYTAMVTISGGFVAGGGEKNKPVLQHVAAPTPVGGRERITPARVENSARDLHGFDHLTQGEAKIPKDQSCGLCHAPQADKRIIRINEPALVNPQNCAQRGCHDDAEKQQERRVALAQYNKNRQHPFQLPEDWALSHCDRCHEAREGEKVAIKATVHANRPDWRGIHGTIARSAAASVATGQGVDPIFVCSNCHDGAKLAVAVSGKAPDIAIVPTDCDGCHTPSAYSPNVSQSPHPSGFPNHKFDFLKAPRSCGKCHTGSSPTDKFGLCRDCHDTEFIHSPHPDDFLDRHSGAGRSFTGDLCAACHTPPATPSQDVQPAKRAICGGCHRPGK